MLTVSDKRIHAPGRVLGALLIALAGPLAVTSPALAGQDQLKGGSVLIQLQGARGLKLRPGSLDLAITGGAIDPIDGSGSARVSGGFVAKRGKGKTKVIITRLIFGAGGAPGTISAKVGKKSVGAFGRLVGGSVSRAGWGARIGHVTATIAAKGAQALNRAFSSRRGKGARRSRGGGVKAGQPLGTVVSVVTVPLTVEVVPGSGSIVLHTNPTGAFVSKLSHHCIDPLPTGSPAGVSPIAPAAADITGTVYTFPVSGGAVAPDFSAGELDTAGGQTIKKNTSILNPSPCGTADPPVGTQLISTNFASQFDRNTLASLTTLPSGASLVAALGNIDWSTGSRSIDPNTKQLTVTGASLSLAPAATFALNLFFPNESGSASNDFATGDLIGTVDMTAKLR